MTDLSGRAVLVTGASSGIGRATVELLSSKGCPVWAGARSAQDLDSLGALAHVTPLSLDVTRPEEVDRAVTRVRATDGGLFGLVNCAGIGNLGPLAEMSIDELHEVLAVNLDGAHRMIAAMFPLLRESKGRIVNISSISGFLVEPLIGPYNISKHALEAYSDVLREEVAALGIRVITIEPGAFQTRIFDSGLRRRGDELRRRWTGSDSVYRDQVLQTLTYLEQPNVRHRLEYPLPVPVAHAVTHALFDDEPKSRYVVGTAEELSAVVDRLLSLTRELNESHPGRLPPEELARRLRGSDGLP
ncbi:MAG TPA: SDR family oxidoreductase [Thermoplasmata archaeon]|nr:SDR family oxidoreductase [Thermoplasmata archaeon]